MAAKPMDALTSFQHVADNVHRWKVSISELAVYAAKQHEIYVAEYTRLLSQAKTKKRKSESMVSMHSADEQVTPLKDAIAVKSPNASDLIDISPLEVSNRFIYTQAHRKRKPGTSLRSNASGELKYRNKHMVVVYYDAHIQSELDKMMKALGTARNNLRKGKNAHTAAKGFSLPSLNRRFELPHSLSPNLNSKSSSGSQSSKLRADSPHKSPQPMTVDAAFPSTDKELEAIQSLCETAAHQILRDGDCKTELEAALQKLDTVVDLADTALSLIRTEQSKEELPSRSTESSSLSDQTSTGSTLCEKASSEVINVYQKNFSPTIQSLLGPKISAPAESLGPPTVLAADAIEVDDDSSDSMADFNLNIANIRAAGRARLVS